LRVTDRQGKKLSWARSAARFVAASWGLLAWSALGAIVYTLHRNQQLVFELGHLTWRQLGVPLLYTSLAALVFVTFAGGYLLALFHPQKRSLHDLVAGSDVRRRS
jgi:uncharacterized RDD family membrane protein YckC